MNRLFWLMTLAYALGAFSIFIGSPWWFAPACGALFGGFSPMLGKWVTRHE
jgi:hypothetical protein